MNSINPDLEFTIEIEGDFENKRLPTLRFEIWSTKEKIRHSYCKKGMRSKVLTEKTEFTIRESEVRYIDKWDEQMIRYDGWGDKHRRESK